MTDEEEAKMLAEAEEKDTEVDDNGAESPAESTNQIPKAPVSPDEQPQQTTSCTTTIQEQRSDASTSMSGTSGNDAAQSVAQPSEVDGEPGTTTDLEDKAVKRHPVSNDQIEAKQERKVSATQAEKAAARLAVYEASKAAAKAQRADFFCTRSRQMLSELVSYINNERDQS